MTDPNNIADKIMEAVEALPFPAMLKSGQGNRTAIDILGKLGRKLGYKILCRRSHFSDTDDVEWLYDMTWYTEDKEKFFTGMSMVLESELNRRPKHRDEVDGDFHKLVQARADVRVWISTSPNDARLHIDNCKRQIQLFSGTTSGDQYMFAVFDWTAEKPLIERFVVQ